MSHEHTGEVLALKWRIAQSEETLGKRDHQLSLAVTYDTAKVLRIGQLEAELAEWRALRAPDHLAAQLMQGVPALLDIAQAERLLVKLQVAAESPE